MIICSNYVFSMTTTPTRIFLLDKTIDSLLHQTIPPYAVILNIPYKSSRSGQQDYPADLTHIQQKHHDKIIIHRIETDYGPVCKLLPTLQSLQTTHMSHVEWIVTVDDDILYPETLIQNYQKIISQYPHMRVFGLSGLLCDPKGLLRFVNKETATDILEGYASIVYHRSCLTREMESYILSLINDQDCKYSDDLIVSNFLALKNIIRWNIKRPGFQRNTILNTKRVLTYGLREDALHYNNQCIKRYHKVCLFLKKKGLLATVFQYMTREQK